MRAGAVRRAGRVLRQAFAPAGKHRPHRDEQTVHLVGPRRSTQATVDDIAYCPAEERNTLHAFLRLGGRVCWTCRTFTDHPPLTSTPPQGGAQ